MLTVRMTMRRSDIALPSVNRLNMEPSPLRPTKRGETSGAKDACSGMRRRDGRGAAEQHRSGSRGFGDQIALGCRRDAGLPGKEAKCAQNLAPGHDRYGPACAQ